MSYLLDTHTLIWAITEPQKLSATAKKVLINSENEILVSAVSFWEISLKYSIGKLTLEGYMPEDFPTAAIATGFKVIPLTAETTSTYHRLKASYHRDPFDKMLIWQAIQHNFTLISCDENVHKYESEGLKVIW
ncbi:type II toxin-antitoxin system VapC family toxin [Runella salmonicolor]|uniref:Type II toxin-antitoxin system VapC family toxin n=1 Tax=Runella salmonicolor TaxID=2950278 RepID=A0ABT1FHU3_9BACT|nr:type II toxin-antitoxin system VapC family toxin [Runella salmonicolor]MCP1381336.1 type II toxin-antitoxin system VapC family toxin [Runella salmonicolor]